jgi:hypothetical protein
MKPGEMQTSVLRYDAGQLRKPSRTKDGFFKADAILSRVGVFPYRTATGGVRRELRLPEEVFKEDALTSFSLLPITSDHPSVPVTPANAKEYQRGSVGESVRQDGEFLIAPIMVTDADLIQSVTSGKQKEVSCGYHCDLEWTAGKWNGQEYDCIQRNIRGNHVAMVARGRAGPEVSVRLDSSDAIMVTETEEEKPMVKFRIDGIEYEVSEQAVQALDKQAQSNHAALKAAQSLADTAQATADKATARADAAEAKLKEVEKETSPASIQARVQARATLERQALAVSKDLKLDGLDDAAVVKAVVAHAVPDLKLDGLSNDYLRARFDIAVADAEKVAQKKGALNAAALDGNHKDADESPAKTAAAARAAMLKQNLDAWKSPLASSQK